MNLRHLVAALPLFLPVVAFADEPVDTVRVLMGMASHNPADGQYVQDEYFSANMLLRFFSEDFNRAFATALLKTNERREEVMIDWDPIVGGQDNCPLRDIVYGPQKDDAGKIQITVGFKAKSCFDDESGKTDITKVTFTLLKEELVPGSPVYLIDDIAHRGEPSLKTTLAEIAK